MTGLIGDALAHLTKEVDVFVVTFYSTAVGAMHVRFCDNLGRSSPARWGKLSGRWDGESAISISTGPQMAKKVLGKV